MITLSRGSQYAMYRSVALISALTIAALPTGLLVIRLMAQSQIASWATPTIFPAPERPQLITNASKFRRGYDPATGTELWRLGGSSKITAPTPIFTPELIIVASRRRPEKPIFAIRPDATGDITLRADETGYDFIAWTKTDKGSYMPKPIIYDRHLYVLAKSGILDCDDVATGENRCRERIAHFLLQDYHLYNILVGYFG